MGNLIINKNVTFLICNHNHLGIIFPYDSKGIHKEIIIHGNVWISCFVFVVLGFIIGEGTVIGEQVFSKDVPKCAIVCSNPTQIIKHRDGTELKNLTKNTSFFLVEKYNKKFD